MAKHVKSQKTQLFTVIAGVVVRFICPKKISFGQDSFGKIDVTCLDAETKEYERGMRDPGEGAIGIDLDDENTSHDKLMEIAASGEKLQWYVGSSHSVTPPTYDATTVIDLPETRSWWSFEGYLNDAAPNDIEVDTVIGYEFTLVRTSGVKYTKRTMTVTP